MRNIAVLPDPFLNALRGARHYNPDRANPFFARGVIFVFRRDISFRISQSDIRGIWFPALAAARPALDMASDEAILREAGCGYGLTVLGASRRPGDMLFFGNTAVAVLERSPTLILFVAR
jgi:hypothetical protein